MEIQLKQRLIGAVVIFTLLIIFLPMFFDQDSDTQNIEQLLTPLSKGTVDPIDSNPVIDSKEISDFIADNSVLLSQNSADKTVRIQSDVANEEPVTVDSDIHVNKPTIKTQKVDNSQAKLAVANSEKIEAKINNKNLTIVEKLKAAEEQTHIPGKRPMDDKPLEKITSSQPAKTIKYNIPTSLGATDVYAVKVSNAKDLNDAEKIKNRLQGMGFPAYTHKTSNDVAVLVGPDLELIYVKELANRVLDETTYQPEIISHNKNWVSSD